MLLALVTEAYGADGGIAQYNRDLMGALAAQDSIKHITIIPRYGKSENFPEKIDQLAPRKKGFQYWMN